MNREMSDSQARGCAIVVGMAFICVALGAYTDWRYGVFAFGVILLGAGIVAK